MRERSSKVVVKILEFSPTVDYSMEESWIKKHGYDHVMGLCGDRTCTYIRQLITLKKIIVGKDYLR